MQDTHKKKYLNSKTVLICPSAAWPGLVGGKRVQHSTHRSRPPKSSGSCLPSTRNWKSLKWLFQNDNIRKKCTCHCKSQSSVLKSVYNTDCQLPATSTRCYKTKRLYWRQRCISCPHGVRSSLIAQVCCSRQIGQYTNWIISSTANHCWHLPHILFSIRNPAT